MLPGEGCPGGRCIRAQRASVKCLLLCLPLQHLSGWIILRFQKYLSFILLHILACIWRFSNYTSSGIYWACSCHCSCFHLGSSAHAQQNCKLWLVCCRCSRAPHHSILIAAWSGETLIWILKVLKKSQKLLKNQRGPQETLRTSVCCCCCCCCYRAPHHSSLTDWLPGAAEPQAKSQKVLSKTKVNLKRNQTVLVCWRFSRVPHTAAASNIAMFNALKITDKFWFEKSPTNLKSKVCHKPSETNV